ncbi:PLP-dependent aminotransferase family protein [Bacillus sp. 1P06AnD]|uniref:MocR-like transcriptional regulator GabR n=1 Tax=Bacillus sp. 1P06AnD TaxID=3132208 RepID=UPI0039A07838
MKKIGYQKAWDCMLYLSIDHSKETGFIYKQVYEGIKNGILSGRITSDEKLPSKRNLAGQLNVSVNSIATAYEQLLAEGYIYSKERSGYFVENMKELIQHEPAGQYTLPDDLRENKERDDDWLSLSHMTANMSLFPFKNWFRCQREAIINHQQELSEMAHPQGPYIVRETISKMIALTRGVKSEPEQIVIGAGTHSLIRQLMELMKKEAVIAVENPGYARFYTLLKRLGRKVAPVALDKKGIDPAGIAAIDADLLSVTPSHQFPTGIIMPISRRIELLNWAFKNKGRYIIEDDYDSEFKYRSDIIPSLQSLDSHNKVIYTGTFSKSMYPGFRISYMVLPPDLLRLYRERFQDGMQYSNTLNLYTLHYFIQDGGYLRHVKKMNHHYEHNRGILIEALKKRFKKDIEIDDIPAGLHLLAHFCSEKTYAEIEEHAKRQKLEIYTMKRFMLNGAEKHGKTIDLVIGFANIEANQIEEAVERLYRILH